MNEILVPASDPQGLRRYGIPIHPITALKLAEKGEFPAPIRLGHRRLWRMSDLRAWISSKAAEAA